VSAEVWNSLESGRNNFPDYGVLSNLRSNPDVPVCSSLSVLLGLNMINNDADNPYTVLENVMRLSDVTSVQSNVFAVWITVGYFESDEDGGNLGSEMGLADGTVVRHRGFYTIDRSVPVGFRLGETLNTKDVILKSLPLPAQ
jgi:hypothetical protein